jgi:transcriptional regulator with XRE-family HTH domain
LETFVETETSGARLRNARKALGLTLEEFGDPLGVTKGAVSRWENGDAPLPKLTCLAIERGHGISSEWLIAGEGSMFLPSVLARGLDDDLEFRPVVPGAATCGPGGEISDPGPNAERIPFRREFLQKLAHGSGAGSTETLFCVECAGESMRPTIHPGDLAIINTALDLRIKPKRSALYLVRPDAASTDGRIKRVRVENGQLWFVSDAPGFTSVSVPVNETPLQSLVLGRVCWIGRMVLKEETFEMNW